MKLDVSWGRTLLVGLLALALAGCAAAGSGPGDAGSQGATETITVTGYGEAGGDPDIATVQVGVNVADSNISRAVSLSNETIRRITAAVQGLGVEATDIQTTGFNIWPEDQYDRATGERLEEKLYRVDSTVQINVRQIDLVGRVLETAIQNGATNVYGLNFGIQDTSGLATEARSAAIADARARAEQLAAELGATLGKVQNVKEVSGGPVFPYFAGAGLGLGGGGGEPPISRGQMTVSVSLEVTFEFVR